MIPPGAFWVRMPRFIGDAVMIHQALGPLWSLGSPLVAWGPANVMELFEGSGSFAACVADPEPLRAWDMAKLLRQFRAEGVINLPRSSRALLAAFLARTPVRVGWSEGGGGLLATTSLRFKGQTGHQMHRYGNLIAKAFPALPQGAPCRFRPSGEAFDQASALREAFGIHGPYVVLALGAKHWNKRLGTPVMVDLLDRLEREGIPALVLGGPQEEDRAQGRGILALRPQANVVCGRSSLSVSAALVADALAVVGNDSSLSHLAAASGTVTLVAFGPTLPEVTAPQGPNVRVFQKAGLNCLGCMRFDCRIQTHACMQQLETGPMFDRILETQRSLTAASAPSGGPGTR
ncbi:glycosyltransferase family 9 protein [Geothrix campi]|uniref:glycosyltransferase family 9 protein n=1 Tax=Geothrix campi TaxID=2966450 RepID=UPI00214796EC